MERKKWWASLIAVAVGLAFSVGSASAYEQGDFAEGTEGKLIPYYMAGDNTATIIGVENQATVPDTGVSIIEVRVLDAMGVVQAIGQLCLAPNQFGYAVLKEEMMMMDDMGGMDDMDSRVALMVGVGDDMSKVYGVTTEATTGVSGRAGSAVNMTSEGSSIAYMGYVVVSDLGTFTTLADQAEDDIDLTNDGCDSQGTPDSNDNSKFAAWAILQDVGEGSFFGTEISTATVITSGDPDDATTPVPDRVDCATTPDDCEGLIVEDQEVTVRFDNNMANMSMSMVYVWAPAHVTFDPASGTRAMREVSVMVYCEGAAEAEEVMLDLPDRVNMVYGSMLGCDARGTAMFTVPAENAANNLGDAISVWSHISQMGGGFRMNFTGYHDSTS